MKMRVNAWAFVVAAIAAIVLLELVSVTDPRPILIMQSACALVPLAALPFIRRPVSRWALVSILVLAVFSVAPALWVTGNWYYYQGHAAWEKGDARASESLRNAVDRMDAPGIEVPGTRVRLTRYGPVSQFRVTSLMALANIELQAGKYDAAAQWLRRAISAAKADPSEEADLEFLGRMLREVEEREADDRETDSE